MAICETYAWRQHVTVGIYSHTTRIRRCDAYLMLVITHILSSKLVCIRCTYNLLKNHRVRNSTHSRWGKPPTAQPAAISCRNLPNDWRLGALPPMQLLQVHRVGLVDAQRRDRVGPAETLLTAAEEIHVFGECALPTTSSTNMRAIQCISLKPLCPQCECAHMRRVRASAVAALQAHLPSCTLQL
jgi:hypothetical protein